MSVPIFNCLNEHLSNEYLSNGIGFILFFTDFEPETLEKTKIL